MPCSAFRCLAILEADASGMVMLFCCALAPDAGSEDDAGGGERRIQALAGEVECSAIHRQSALVWRARLRSEVDLKGDRLSGAD